MYIIVVLFDSSLGVVPTFELAHSIPGIGTIILGFASAFRWRTHSLIIITHPCACELRSFLQNLILYIASVSRKKKSNVCAFHDAFNVNDFLGCRSSVTVFIQPHSQWRYQGHMIR